MTLAQLEFLNTAINKLDGSPLFWILLVSIISVTLLQFKDIMKMVLKFKEDCRKAKFDRENKTAEALEMNAKSLLRVTDYLKDRCNEHKYNLHEAANKLNITPDEKKDLKEVIDNVSEK